MDTDFTSQRIRFVSVSESLIADYLAMVNDVEHVARFIGSRREPFSRAEELSWVREKLAQRAILFSMLEKDTGAFIGNIELMDAANGKAELGIAITAAMQDKGYGTEAIRTMVRYGMEILGLHRIFLKVYPHNARAIHVYKKCGFREYERTADDVFMEITQ
jgi:diamine N-acetyltransferase